MLDTGTGGGPASWLSTVGCRFGRSREGRLAFENQRDRRRNRLRQVCALLTLVAKDALAKRSTTHLNHREVLRVPNKLDPKVLLPLVSTSRAGDLRIDQLAKLGCVRTVRRVGPPIDGEPVGRGGKRGERQQCPHQSGKKPSAMWKKTRHL